MYDLLDPEQVELAVHLPSPGGYIDIRQTVDVYGSAECIQDLWQLVQEALYADSLDGPALPRAEDAAMEDRQLELAVNKNSE